VLAVITTAVILSMNVWLLYAIAVGKS
jgi:hypothetical protein